MHNVGSNGVRGMDLPVSKGEQAWVSRRCGQAQAGIFNSDPVKKNPSQVCPAAWGVVNSI